MLLHGVKGTEFEIYHGDTLTNDWDMLRETNPAKMVSVVPSAHLTARSSGGVAAGSHGSYRSYGNCDLAVAGGCQCAGSKGRRSSLVVKAGRRARTSRR